MKLILWLPITWLLRIFIFSLLISCSVDSWDYYRWFLNTKPFFVFFLVNSWWKSPSSWVYFCIYLNLILAFGKFQSSLTESIFFQHDDIIIKNFLFIIVKSMDNIESWVNREKSSNRRKSIEKNGENNNKNKNKMINMMISKSTRSIKAIYL